MPCALGCLQETRKYIQTKKLLLVPQKTVDSLHLTCNEGGLGLIFLKYFACCRVFLVLYHVGGCLF